MVITSGVPLLKYRRTKIVATVGPASREPAVLEALIKSGVNVFRLNMSHGSHDAHREAYLTIRAAADACNAQVAVFADLCGPKIRTGVFPGGPITLTDGQMVCVTTRDVPGTPALIPSQYAALAQDVVPGDRILLDDGNLELRVEAIQDSEITCTVVHGGMLKNNKGMNLPGVNVSAPALTEKDQADARFAIALGVDLVALSFVRQAGDVEALRALMREGPRQVPIISKIEKPEALENIEDILRASDAIMIARGDLGVELPPQNVPNVQEELVAFAREYHKPVIVATQMLETMITNARPTRAEVTDVANAVRGGADAVMLSGETAAGAYPVEAVVMMDTIIREVEGHQFARGAFSSLDPYAPVHRKPAPPIPIDMAVANSTTLLSRELLVRGIAVLTRSGRSVEVMSAARPAAPIVGVSADPDVARFCCLLWGVLPVTIPDWEQQDPRILAMKLARDCGLATTGQTILMVRGFRTDAAENSPSISVISIL